MDLDRMWVDAGLAMTRRHFFGVNAAGLGTAVLATLLGELPDKYAAIASSISALGYAFSRGFAKGGPGK